MEASEVFAFGQTFDIRQVEDVVYPLILASPRCGKLVARAPCPQYRGRWADPGYGRCRQPEFDSGVRVRM